MVSSSLLRRLHNLLPLVLDGKTLRGSRKRGGQECHPLTAVFHEIGLVWTEAAVEEKTNEIPTAKALLGYRRGHWHIENGIHSVRDVTFDEDRRQVRCGNVLYVLGMIRHRVLA